MNHRIMTILPMMMVIVLIAACASQLQTSANLVASHGGKVEDQVSLMNVLRAAGAKVELGDSIEQSFFSVKGQILKVNGIDVQVFRYESAETMETEAALVSADGGSVGTSMVTWVATPHFFKSGHMLILFVGDDTAVLNVLKGALGEQFAGR